MSGSGDRSGAERPGGRIGHDTATQRLPPFYGERIVMKVFGRLAFDTLLFVVYASGGMFFAFAYGQHLATLNGDKLGPLLIPCLAVFYGFAALLYNRARALDAGPERRRSLYAAERALQATIFYVCSVAVAAGIYGVQVVMRVEPLNVWDGIVPIHRLLIVVVPIALMISAWASFFFGLRVIAHRTFLRRTGRLMTLRRLRGKD